MERFLEPFTNLAFVVVVVVLADIRLYSVAVCRLLSDPYISASHRLAWR